MERVDNASADAEGLRTLLDEVPSVLVELDREGRVVRLNRAGQRILGVSEDQARGLDWFEAFVPPRLRREVRRVFDGMMSGQLDHTTAYENPVLTAHGEERMISWRNGLLSDGRGRYRGSVSSGTDVTAHYDSSQEEALQRQAAQQLLSLRSEEARWRAEQLDRCRVELSEARAELDRSLQALERSESTCAALLEASLDLALLVDDGGHVIACNGRSWAFFGRSPSEMLGACVFDHFPPEVAERRRSLAKRVLESGNAARYIDVTERGRYDTVVYPALRGAPTPRLVVLVRNVSEHHRTIQELQEAEERLQVLVDGAFSGIAVAEAQEMRLLHANPAFCRMLGLARHEVVATSLRDLFGTAIPLPEANAQGVPIAPSRVSDVALRRRDGSVQYVDVQFSVLPFGGRPSLAVTLRDASERRHSADALRRALAETARRDAEIASIANAAAHDLREPLRTISSYLSLLQRRYASQLGEDADEFLAFATDAAARQQQMLAALLAYARVGEAPVAPQAVSTEVVVQRALDTLAATREGAAGRVDLLDPLPRVAGHEGQLEDLFLELLRNAFKFRGPRPAEIELRCRRIGNEHLFSLRDRGLGFDSRHSEHIFGVFRRLHGVGEYPGTGMGLAICKRIVERHGGRIWAEAEPDQGAVFQFTLPAVEEEA